MVRLPAAGSVKSQEAALGVRPKAKRPRRERVRPTDRGLRGDDEQGPGEDDGQDGEAEALLAETARAELEERAPEEPEELAEEREDERGPGGSPVAVREPPADTPAKIAQVFRRLPVSVHDGPPLEGIGSSGIHIDRIWLGSKNTRQGCGGKDDNFSISGGDEVNVCFRVVHGRVEEDVDVIWEKDGDLAQRRRGVTIPAAHAYRSRSYLALRGEYVGAWRVRIFSVDGVELATKTFKVVD